MKIHAAERYCKSLGAHLVEFHTKAQYDFLMKYGKKAGSNWYWIGLKQKQGAWYWIHSKTKINSFFQKKVTKGAGSSGNYVMIYPNDHWHKITRDYRTLTTDGVSSTGKQIKKDWIE